MTKDREISAIMALAEKYYPQDKFNHAMRVAGYAMAAAQYDPRVDPIDAYIVGVAHDLVEDTDCPQEKLQQAIGYDLSSSVFILTKSDDISYNNYILDLLASNDDLAFLVKRADMKDHLTLTDKPKDKYLSVLHYFL